MIEMRFTMSRIPINKELQNARLLKDYASWIYCTNCNKTVAYLCYVTYNNFDFSFTCNCGSKGSVKIDFNTDTKEKDSQEFILSKNRLCCPNDHSPLLTIIDKNIEEWSGTISCVECNKKFQLQNKPNKK